MAKGLSQAQVDFLRKCTHRHGVDLRDAEYQPHAMYYGPAKVLKKKGLIYTNGSRAYATSAGFKKLQIIAKHMDGRCWALSTKWGRPERKLRQAPADS